MLMLGRDHVEYGKISRASLGSVNAYLSVGSDPNSPSLGFKADKRSPNDDGLLIKHNGRLILLAVADAHFGVEASHRLLERLEACELPEFDLAQESAVWALRDLCEKIQHPTVHARSGTTFLVTLYQPETGRVLALSTGDSTLATLIDGVWEVRNRHNNNYIHLDLPSFPDEWETVSFTLPPNALLVLHTDGIDECHYRCPATSLRPHHISALWDGTPEREFEERASRFGLALTQSALDGVDGNPGGQDNIAMLLLARPEA